MTGINRPLTDTPSESHWKSHYHCDFIELLALVRNAEIVSGSDVLARYTDFEGGVDDDANNVGHQGRIDYGEISDNWENKIHDWFSILSSRSEVYGDSYPFEVSLERHHIKLKSDISEINYVYIFLLLCSLLRYFDGSSSSKLTTDFEEISLQALERYLPDQSIVHKFGKSNISNSRYTGLVREKIDLLASDLRKPTKYKEHFFGAGDSGDLGIDLVSWLPFSSDDNFSYIQLLFAQCGAGKDWVNKQKEPSTSVTNCIDEIENPINALFIPYDARNADRQFCEEKKIGKDILLFDRIRILKLLENEAQIVTALSSYQQPVVSVLNYEEGLV